MLGFSRVLEAGINELCQAGGRSWGYLEDYFRNVKQRTKGAWKLGRPLGYLIFSLMALKGDPIDEYGF